MYFVAEQGKVAIEFLNLDNRRKKMEKENG